MCVSAETLNPGRVVLIGCGLSVVEWVVTGCVVLFTLLLVSLSMLANARQQKNLAWWEGGYREAGG